MMTSSHLVIRKSATKITRIYNRNVPNGRFGAVRTVRALLVVSQQIERQPLPHFLNSATVQLNFSNHHQLRTATGLIAQPEEK